MAAFKLFVAIIFVSLANGSTEEEIDDGGIDSSGTDFLRISSIRFPTKRVFGGSPEPKSLQQTHGLGSFHHRFHPIRFGFQFGSNPTQGSFPPPTHIIPPGQQENRGISSLRFPSVRDNPEERDLVPPQPLEAPGQSYKHASKQQNSFDSDQDQYIRNSYPSDAPRTIKFSISSQDYNPNRGKHFSSPATPQPPPPPQKIGHHLGSDFVRGRFASGSLLAPTRSNINQGSDLISHRQQANRFDNPPRSDQGTFQNFNLQAKPSFGPPQIPPSPQPSLQYNLNYNFRPQPSNDISTGTSFGGKSNPVSDSDGNVNLQRTIPTAPTKFSTFIQSSVELKQEEPIEQQNFGRQQPIQTHFPFPTIPTRQPYFPSASLPIFNYNPTEQQPNFNAAYSSQNDFENPTTEFPRQSRVETSRHPDPTAVSPTVSLPVPTLPDLAGRKLVYQKSRDQLRFALGGNFLTNQQSNDISPSPLPEDGFTTARTNYQDLPGPEIKEITIDLNDRKTTGDGTPDQLYIKEDRQKEFEDIQAKAEENEKTQEDLINEQIHKLLQSQNLEIVGKDSLPETDSPEAQLSKVSEKFAKFNYSVQLLDGGDLSARGREKQVQSPEAASLPPLPDLPEHIKKQYEIKLINKEDLLKQFKVPGDHDWSSSDSSKVFLANGQNLEVVDFSKDGITNGKIAKPEAESSTTTAKPPKALFEELRRQVIPPGANFELIRHNEDGQIEKVDDVAGAKKVTFVFLEEQPDGSVKIQGVKGNANEEEEGNDAVDSIIKKIKNGSLKLPPSQKPEGRGPLTNEIQSRSSLTTNQNYVTLPPQLSATPTPRNVRKFPSAPTTDRPIEKTNSLEPERATTEFRRLHSPDARFSFSPHYQRTTPQPAATFSPSFDRVRTKQTETFGSSFRQQPTTVSTVDTDLSTTFGSRRIRPTTSPALPWHQRRHPTSNGGNGEAADYADSEILSHRPTEYRGQRLRVPEDVVGEESIISPVRPLNDVLEQNGLKEMAKLLDQSGLNEILNETGPFTIFVPTDEAFNSLKAQLGGSDVAEDKFRENPRLLSGLLLHHVVPGSFRVEDLQDEMTGVSLAGTQLRVNSYTSDETKSRENGVGTKTTKATTTTTINGAKISSETKNILVPQGLAHSIDRVLFPLPIGDILQTLRTDRERRFTKFLKALEYSGLAEILSGSKTYTVFAPTDKAFSVLTDSELEKLLTRREAAKTISLRHIVPGTLYTSGMKFYQVKDSMEKGQKVTIRKEFGKIKANSAQIVSANIPATNGVIHAVETLL